MASHDEMRVIIAMDGSKFADYAFEWYLNNIHKQRNYVILVHSVEFHALASMPMGVGAGDLIVKMVDEEKAHADLYIAKLKEMMQSHRLHGKVKQMSGSPRTDIIRAAEEDNVDLIVTGTRGMGTVRRTFLGSVSDHVLHHAHVPVLVCRHVDDHKHHGQDTHM